MKTTINTQFKKVSSRSSNKLTHILFAAILLFSFGGAFAQQGTGLTEEDYLLVPSVSNINYGHVLLGESAEASLSLTNVGTYQAIISGLFTNSGEFIVNSALPIYVQPGETVEVSASFVPSGTGLASETLTIVNAPDMDVQLIQIPVTGIGDIATINITPRFTDDGVVTVETHAAAGEQAEIKLYQIFKNGQIPPVHIETIETVLSEGATVFEKPEWAFLTPGYYKVELEIPGLSSGVIDDDYTEKLLYTFDYDLTVAEDEVFNTATISFNLPDFEIKTGIYILIYEGDNVVLNQLVSQSTFTGSIQMDCSGLAPKTYTCKLVWDGEAYDETPLVKANPVVPISLTHNPVIYGTDVNFEISDPALIGSTPVFEAYSVTTGNLVDSFNGYYINLGSNTVWYSADNCPAGNYVLVLKINGQAKNVVSFNRQ